MDKTLRLINKILVATLVILFPIFVLPGFSSPYFVPKEILAVIILSLLLITNAIGSIRDGKLKFSPGKFDIGVLFIVAAYIITTIFGTPNKMEAFFYPGVTTFVVISAVFYFVINGLTKKGKNEVLLSLFVSGILLSISILFIQLGVFTKIPQLPAFMKDPGFNPLGSNFQSIAYLLTILTFGIVRAIKEKDTIKKIFFGVASSVIVLGIVLVGINLLPGKADAPILPTPQASWEIAIETLKKSPIFGSGPANYLTAFNLYRPIAYNQSNLWQVRFSSANNFYFSFITELGLIGIVAFVVLLVSIYKKLILDYKNKSWDSISIVILLIAFVFMPSVPALTFLLMVLLAIFSGSEEKSITVAEGKVPAAISVTPILAGIIALSIFGGKAVFAEVNYKKSLDALTKNNAKDTYEYMAKATKMNPYVDRYHASLAQIDMALANSLAEKKDISDNDRSTITQLVQEAISEGKATVTLNPGRSGNWEILGQIYRNIMSFAEGSDQFAIQTYSQAVALDPINPDLRISLGGVYYALGKYDEAITSFQLAVAAKNDLANAHYNLAAAYAAKKEFDKAITEINTVISLLPSDSADLKTAETALEQLKKQKPATTSDTSESLVAPQTKKESNITPPITLPSEATPPATP